MRRGTTPSIVFHVDIDLSTAEVVYVTFNQHKRTIVEKSKEDITINETWLTVPFTQEETLRFKEGNVECQISYRMPDGSADRSSIIELPILRILKDEVI